MMEIVHEVEMLILLQLVTIHLKLYVCPDKNSMCSWSSFLRFATAVLIAKEALF